MCDCCTQKAEDMAELARFFRDAAAETRQNAYRALMTKAAADLDQLCRRYRGCGEPARCRAQPALPPLRPGDSDARDGRGRICA